MQSLAVAMGSKWCKEAEELRASGECAVAVVALKRAVDIGHLPSRALMCHMLLQVREGVDRDINAAFEMVEEGARLGCYRCKRALQARARARIKVCAAIFIRVAGAASLQTRLVRPRT